MQKKLLALAIAGALAPAAAMAQSTVEIYGRANLGIDSWEAKGGARGDYDRRWRVFDGSSRLGFRINESLGGGMRAFAVIETGINIDTGSQASQSGEPNGSSGFWASRDSYVGIGGGWGDVRFGRQSIWWSGGVISQTGANYLHTAADSVLTDSALVAVPVTRQSNVVSYNSPTIGGFNASISYSPNSEAAAPGAETDARIYGVTGRFTTGAIRAQVDWAKNEAATTATGAPGTEITGLKVGLGFAYAPGSQISGWWGRLDNDRIAAVAGIPFATAGANLEQDFWLVNLEHMLGPWQLLAQYYRAGEVESSAGGEIPGSKSNAYTLAAKYFLSKRTGVYLSFNHVKNEANAFKDFSGGGISSATGTGNATGLPAADRGADVRIIALGVMHNF
jgi:predicted porin